MVRVDFSKLGKDQITSIIVEWFYAANDLAWQKGGIELYTYDIPASSILINNQEKVLAYHINENGETKRTIIKQTPHGFTIKSDQYFNSDELPLKSFNSDNEFLFVMSEPSERQYIKLVLK